MALTLLRLERGQLQNFAGFRGLTSPSHSQIGLCKDLKYSVSVGFGFVWTAMMALTIAAKGPAGSVRFARSLRRAGAIALMGGLGLTGCVTTGAGVAPTAAGLAPSTSITPQPQLVAAKPADQPIKTNAKKIEAKKTKAQKAGAHPEARFIAEYGDARYLVNLRYVSFLRQSVVAVRPFKPDARLEGRKPIAVAASPDAPTGGHFRDRAYRTVAVDIAEALTETPAACADGRALNVAHDKHGAPKASYRRDHRVWIVFARCAAAPA